MKEQLKLCEIQTLQSSKWTAKLTRDTIESIKLKESQSYSRYEAVGEIEPKLRACYGTTATQREIPA